MTKKESTEWFEIFTLVLLMIFALFGFIILAYANLNPEFIAFFFFAAFYIMMFFNKRYKFKKLSAKSKFKTIEYKTNTIKCFVGSFIYIFIGFIHILGKLDFPKFLLLNGWNNGYIIATRILWLILNVLLGILSENLRVYSLKLQLIRQYGKLKKAASIKIDKQKVLIQTLLFPTISIPVTVSFCDFIGLTFVRDFITTFFLSS